MKVKVKFSYYSFILCNFWLVFVCIFSLCEGLSHHLGLLVEICNFLCALNCHMYSWLCRCQIGFLYFSVVYWLMSNVILVLVRVVFSYNYL